MLLPAKDEDGKAGLPSAGPSRGLFLRSGSLSGALASRATPARRDHVTEGKEDVKNRQVNCYQDQALCGVPCCGDFQWEEYCLGFKRASTDGFPWLSHLPLLLQSKRPPMCCF